MESPALPEATNVLLLSPPFDPGERDACADLLSVETPADASLLGVTLTRTPDQWLAEYRRRLPTLPGTVTVVDVGEHPRSTASGGRVQAAHSNVRISTVPNPGNLTDLGVTLTDGLQEIAPAGSDGEAVMCFESAGALHQYADGKTVYQFFRVLADLVGTNGVRAHYHVDPDAIGEQEMNRLLLLFDAVVSVTDDGSWTIRTR